MRQGDYPAGTTQAMHDARYNRDDENAIRAVLEDRADDELRMGDQRVSDYLAERVDGGELVVIVAYLLQGTQAADERLAELRERLQADYVTYRCETASEDERAEIAEASWGEP